MERFKSKDEPTWDEWMEVFDYPKEFSNGDVVEYVNRLWVVLCKRRDYICFDKTELVYKLKACSSEEIALASSTYIFPQGTFIDK